MSYNRANYLRIRSEYDGKNLRAKEAAERRRDELHAKYPDLRAIDDALSSTAFRIMEVTMSTNPGEEREAKLGEIKREMDMLRDDRSRFLLSNGYAAEYTDVKYECPNCSDVGCTPDGRMCVCMKKKLVMAGFESSGISELMKTQTFETFDLRYYDETSRPKMQSNLNYIRSYADSFSAQSGNMLFIGPTGLGKTHLSTSVAVCAINKGFDVVYESAQNIFADFETEKFRTSRYQSYDSEDITERYFECDLLIIDDLGTELSNQFSISTLYNLLNTRINKRAPMIIDTNLARDELHRRYADRITSRLFGEFVPLLFCGRDVRAVKLMRK
nr:ATP-binding protein [Clostridia bacterium]